MPTVHLVHCPFCKAYHRVRLTHTAIGDASLDVELPSEEEVLHQFRQQECPKNHETFEAAEDDWLHLSEDEFYRRYPESRSN
jgi:hypothetical protein